MLPALLVIVGAGLWATDTLFRQPLTEELSSLTIVTIEHGFAAVASLLWAIAVHPRRLLPGWKELSGALLIGALGSGVATVFFTESLLHVNPGVSVLLQKTQPLMVIGLSAMFLDERPSGLFLAWATVAIGSAYLLSFPQGVPKGAWENPASAGVAMALLAAFFWAASTVIGKAVLRKTPASVLAFWRFFGGLLTTLALSRYSTQATLEFPFVLRELSVMKSIGAMALIPGFLGVLLYYHGLRNVRASTATLLELAFPLAAVLINSRVLGFPLQPMQIMAATLLAASIAGLSLTPAQRTPHPADRGAGP
jgi:drug/metabolite transporter (DMT)-like permease